MIKLLSGNSFPDITMHTSGPHFIVIGAQRSGTTWLHRVLSQHPDLWLTPVKELHYFDKRDIWIGALSSAERHRARFLKTWRMLRSPGWFARYWLMPRGDRWYANLFQAAVRQGKVAGEITPAYAVLTDDEWMHISRQFPDLKLIFVMRDPVARSWSALRNAIRKGKTSGEAEVQELIARAREPGVALRSNYTQTIEIVERFFKPENLHCCFFEQLSADPLALSESLFSFLEVDPLLVNLELPPPVNVAAGGDEPPLDFQKALAQDYLPMVEHLSERFGSIPQAWVNRYRALVD